eukprot:978166-Pyramimonas_sp.AAC.1
MRGPPGPLGKVRGLARSPRAGPHRVSPSQLAPKRQRSEARSTESTRLPRDPRGPPRLPGRFKRPPGPPRGPQGPPRGLEQAVKRHPKRLRQAYKKPL